MTRRIPRGAVALAAALVTLAVGGQPVLGAVAIKQMGRTGSTAVADGQSNPGATCEYDSANANALDRIRVRAPTVVQGDYPFETWVGWRFKILRFTNGRWAAIYASSVQKDKASFQPADGFTNGQWNVPGAPSGWYKVRIVILFYKPGSKSNVEGKIVWEYDHYRVQADRLVPYVRNDYCLEQL